MKITIEGGGHAAAQIATALQLALYGAGFEVYYEHGPGDRTSVRDGLAGNMLATTFDNLAALNRTGGPTFPPITIRVREVKKKGA